jgi:PTS system mannose-specific IIA component
MIGIVVASHGQLAAEFVSTARQIVGDFPQVATCSVLPGTSPEALKAELMRAVQSVDDGQGVLVLADLIGGSPCMQSLSLCTQRSLEVVTGVNLPMLLKAASLRLTGVPLQELAVQLAQYGQKNITCASDALRARASAA